MKIKEIDEDIKFLLYLGCSFGGGNKPTAQAVKQLINTEKSMECCGVKIHIYYYSSLVKEQELLQTPFGRHTIFSNQYEGPHHPNSKIENISKYLSYTFNEKGIYNGTDYIFNIDSDVLPAKVDDNMIIALILNLVYSLQERLNYNIKFMEEGNINDYGHVRAAYRTITTINKLTQQLKTLKPCVELYLNFKIPFITTLFNEMGQLLEDTTDEIKNKRILYILNSFKNQTLTGPPPEPLAQPHKPLRQPFAQLNV